VTRRARRLGLWAAQCLLLLGGAAQAQGGTGTAAAPLLLGVQTHFAYDRGMNAARVVEWLQAAHVDSTRDEMFWNEIEDASGAYAIRNGAEFTRRAWWTLLPATSPLLILGYGNPRYDDGGQPKSAGAVAAFAKQAKWLVGATHARVRMVEIWNEWNISAGARPGGGAQGAADDYVHLAVPTTAAVKAADPNVRVLVGGLAEDFPDWRWLREALPLGLLDGADGVSVHLYNHCNPVLVGADEMARRLDGLQDVLTRSAHHEVPVYVTEVGWPVHRGACQVSEDHAGKYTLRLLLEASLRPWLKGVWFYEAIDSGDDPANREHRFGLLRRDGSERPAGCVVRTLGTQLAARPVQVLRQGSVTVAVYRSAQGSLVFAWDREGAAPARVRIAASAGGAAPSDAVTGCALKRGTISASGSGQELRAELSDANPVAFVLPGSTTLSGVRLD
jgi:polysaccharide biosynthesis protein PslG